jgi:hypothetical protein
MEGRRKNEAFGMKWNGKWKDEIIALYLSQHNHPLFSAQQTWNEKVGQKERKRVSIQSGTQQQKFSQMSKGIPYLGSGSDCFCYLRHSGVFEMSGLFPLAGLRSYRLLGRLLASLFMYVVFRSGMESALFLLFSLLCLREAR